MSIIASSVFHRSTHDDTHHVVSGEKGEEDMTAEERDALRKEEADMKKVMIEMQMAQRAEEQAKFAAEKEERDRKKNQAIPETVQDIKDDTAASSEMEDDDQFLADNSQDPDEDKDDEEVPKSPVGIQAGDIVEFWLNENEISDIYTVGKTAFMRRFELGCMVYAVTK